MSAKHEREVQHIYVRLLCAVLYRELIFIYLTLFILLVNMNILIVLLARLYLVDVLLHQIRCETKIYCRIKLDLRSGTNFCQLLFLYCSLFYLVFILFFSFLSN